MFISGNIPLKEQLTYKNRFVAVVVDVVVFEN